MRSKSRFSSSTRKNRASRSDASSFCPIRGPRVPERFPAGTRIKAKVVGVTDYGAFVQIEPGVEGLGSCQRDELVAAREASVENRESGRRCGCGGAGGETGCAADFLGPEAGAARSLAKRRPSAFPVGTVITGRVRSLTDFGAFVEVDEGLEGLIHISDISWTERVKHPSEKFKKGETVQAKVLKVDARKSAAFSGSQAGERYLGELVRRAQSRTKS